LAPHAEGSVVSVSDLSAWAAERLRELRSLGLEEAARSCLIESLAAAPAGSAALVSALAEHLRDVPQAIYLAEPMTGRPPDAVKKATADLAEGFPIGGTRLDLASPPAWLEMGALSRNARCEIQSWLMLDSLLRAHEVSADAVFLERVVTIVNDWVETFVIREEDEEFAWYDMAVGRRASKLAYALRRTIEVSADSEQVLRLILAAEIHLLDLEQREKVALHSNHGLFQMAGLLALAHSLPFLRRAEQARGFAKQLVLEMVGDHFTPDGFHLEHSPAYQVVVANLLGLLLETGWMGRDDRFAKVASGAHRYVAWLEQPDGRLLPLGDSKNVPFADCIAFAGRSPGEPVPQGLLAVPTGGLAISNHGEEQLAFHCQFHSRQHKHADHPSFHFSTQGEQMLTDPGTFTYQYDLPERIYVESTAAHNTVQIDGLNHSRFLRQAFGSGLVAAAEVGACRVLESLVRHAQLDAVGVPCNRLSREHTTRVDVLHRRTLFHLPERFLLIVDVLGSEEEHEYTQWLHVAPTASLERSGPASFSVRGEHGALLGEILPLGEPSPEVLAVKGQRSPALCGWACLDGFRLEPRYSVGFVRRGSDVVVATLVDLVVRGRKQPLLRIGRGGRRIRAVIEYEDGRTQIRYRRRAGGARKITVVEGTTRSTVRLAPHQVVPGP
jgi:hypothetical protein